MKKFLKIKLLNFITVLIIIFLNFSIAKSADVLPTYVRSATAIDGGGKPIGIELNPDGTKVFFARFDSGASLYQYTLTTPFDISTIDTSTEVTLNLNAGSDDLDSTDVEGFTFNGDGTKVYAIDYTGHMNVHTLSTPYDFSDFTQDADDGHDWNTYLTPGDGNIRPHDIRFNSDGTKMYLHEATHTHNPVAIVEYHLATPYLPGSATKTEEFDVDPQVSTVVQDFDFDDDGTRMYVVTSSGSNGNHNLAVYKLSTGFDVTTATHVGTMANFFNADRTEGGTPAGIHFAKDGMKLYQVTYTSNEIHEYDLSCAYGVVLCEVDVSSNVSAQVDFAKKVIQHNTSTVFKRFEWLRRNKEKSNLNSHNIKLNIYNPVLTSLSNQLLASLDNNKKLKKSRKSKKSRKNKQTDFNFVKFNLHLIQNEYPRVLKGWDIDFDKVYPYAEYIKLFSKLHKENQYPLLAFLPITAYLYADEDEGYVYVNEDMGSEQPQASLDNNKLPKTKSNKWSYWSHGDITFGRAGDTITSKPKEVRTSGLMFGADRKIGDSKFIGAAIRIGKDDVDIISSDGTKLDMEALTLNFYGTNGTNLNALIGLSILRIDQLLSETITGERNGKQVFTAIEFKTKNSYGNLNITPSGKIDFGVTQFSDYTDFGTSTTNNVDIYESHTFKTGGLATGFTFDSLIALKEGAVKPNGSFEYIADFTPTTTYFYKNNGNSTTISNDVEKHSLHNLKGNIGFETVFNTGTTFSINYERLQSLNESSHYDNIFFKLGHISEDDSELAFNFNPLQNYQTNINYKRNIYDFDMTFGSNYNMMSAIPDYGAKLEISNKF